MDEAADILPCGSIGDLALFVDDVLRARDQQPPAGPHQRTRQHEMRSGVRLLPPLSLYC
jgi:hypothetical protein